MTVEMPPARWGDPAAAAPLPETARGLVEMAFGPLPPYKPAIVNACGLTGA